MVKIKEKNKGHPDLKKFKDLQIPSILGGKIDALMGIKYANVHPESCLFFQAAFEYLNKSSKLLEITRYAA